MKTLSLILVVLSLININCKQEPPTPSTPIGQKLQVDTLWTTKNLYYSITPMLNSQGDVVVSEMFNQTGKGEIIKLLDKNTGKEKWRWYDYFRPTEGFLDGSFRTINDILILSDWRRIYALDMVTGNTI